MTLLVLGAFACLALAVFTTLSGVPFAAGPFVALAALLLGLAWFGPWRRP